MKMELDPLEEVFFLVNALPDTLHDSSSEFTFCDRDELEADLDDTIQNACDAMRQKAIKFQVVAQLTIEDLISKLPN